MIVGITIPLKSSRHISEYHTQDYGINHNSQIYNKTEFTIFNRTIVIPQQIQINNITSKTVLTNRYLFDFSVSPALMTYITPLVYLSYNALKPLHNNNLHTSREHPSLRLPDSYQQNVSI